MDRWESRGGKSQGRERVSRKKVRQEKEPEERKCRHAKRLKSRESLLPMFRGSRGSKSRLAKAAGAEPSGEMRDERVHAVVARSTFRSQNVQSTPRSKHFWKLRCRKSARGCGAKHISKSKCTKHTHSRSTF